MPKVKLEDGSELEISQASYDHMKPYADSHGKTMDEWVQALLRLTKRSVTLDQYKQIIRGQRKPPSDEDEGGMIH